MAKLIPWAITMDSVSRLKRQRPWLLIGSWVVIALALAAFRFLGLGEPQPVGLYVIYWTAAALLAGLIILLGYAQAIAYASRLRSLGNMADVAGRTAEAEEVVDEFQDTLKSMYGLSLVAFVDAAGEIRDSHQTADGDGKVEALGRLLDSVGKAESVKTKPCDTCAFEIEKTAGVSVGSALGETRVVLPGNQPDSKAGTALLAGPRRRGFDAEQLRFMALLWSNAGWAFGVRPATDAQASSSRLDEFDELLSHVTSPQDIGDVLEQMAAHVSEKTLMDETDGAGLLLVDAAEGKYVASGGTGRLLEWNSRSGTAIEPDFEVAGGAADNHEVVNYSLPGEASGNGLPPSFKGAVFLERLGLDHLLAAQVMQDTGPIGLVVAVRGYPYGAFQPEDEERLLQFAALAAQPMSRALRLATEMDRLTHMDRMAAFKSELVYNISHELRTSLSSLKAATDMLMEGDGTEPGGEYYGRLLHSIARNVRRQESLVANIVDMAGIEEASLHLRLERIDLTSVMTETASIMSPLISQRSQTLLVSIAPDLPQIMADRQRLSQILVNLVSNAQKYSPEGSEIAFSVELRDPNVVFTVSDSGPGVPPEERSQVFEAFYRVQEQRSRGIPGSGLGLAITRSLVDLHAGSIWIEDGPSGGAAFMVSLPIEGSA